MKKVLIAALFILSVAIVNAKETDTKSTTTADTDSQATMVIFGSIADEISGESLVGVEVKIEGTDRKAYTDFDGNFSFEGVKPGEYKLVANYISYEKQSKVLTVDAQASEVKIKLQSSN